MKQIFTLLTSLFLYAVSNSQIVLNEIYPEPGTGKHEFFELYNNNNSSLPLSLKGYTLITFFEESWYQKGFYVLDLPDLSIQSKSFFVGSSGAPFSYQGVTSCTKTQFSWNDLSFLAANNGYLKKWIVGNKVPNQIDGNAYYDEITVPSNFNDLMSKKSGGGANYTVFIYKNGMLINAFFGGTSGNKVPDFITRMPRLKVDISGGGKFNINFSNYDKVAAEYVTSDAGSDNGYIRKKDGLCQSWGKSSSKVHHTPHEPNGPPYASVGTIVLAAAIERSASSSDSSILQYQVVSSPKSEFPLKVDLYIDNGNTPNELDATDTYISTKTIDNIDNVAYQTKFYPYDASMLVAVKTAAGCFDQVLSVKSIFTILPIKISSFDGTLQNDKVQLRWIAHDNETGNLFEVEKSHDGKSFKSIAYVFTSQKIGVEEYIYKETEAIRTLTFYRLKVINHDRTVSYSNILKFINPATAAKQSIHLLNNPIETYLPFTYYANTRNSSVVSIYNMSGQKIFSTRLAAQVGMNTHTLNMGGKIYAGSYLLEVVNGNDRMVTRFIKGN